MSEKLRYDMSSRVAITGAGGQIGSLILTHLQIRGFSVFPVGRNNLLSDIIEIKPDLIINCIGRGSDYRRVSTEEEIWNSNYYVPSEILNFAINNKIKFRIIFNKCKIRIRSELLTTNCIKSFKLC